MAASALEMRQDAARGSGTFEQAEPRLGTVMREVRPRCRVTAGTYGGNPDDHAFGADTVGLLPVAEAMAAQGVI